MHFDTKTQQASVKLYETELLLLNTRDTDPCLNMHVRFRCTSPFVFLCVCVCLKCHRPSVMDTDVSISCSPPTGHPSSNNLAVPSEPEKAERKDAPHN